MLVTILIFMSFTLVSYKKKKHKKKSNHEEYFIMYDVLSTSYRDRLTQKIMNAKHEIITTDIFAATKSSIEQSLTHLSKNHIEDIVCYGLGNFSECKIALYQLALLLALQQCYDCEVMLYDPQFKELEVDILITEKCNLIAYNEKGKRKVDKTTLFFLPHCPNKLFNNIISANWGLSLHNCVIIGNRFSEIIANSPNRVLQKNLPYLFFIGPSMVEIEIKNNFKYSDVFNDMAVHCFPIEKLLIADEQLWKKTFEETDDESLELITKSVNNMKLEPSFPL